MWIEADQMEDGGLEVTNANRVLGDVVTDVVGLAIGAWFDAGAGHPHGEGMGMVVTPVEAFFQG